MIFMLKEVSCLGKNTTSKFAIFWEYKKTQNKT